MKHTIVAIIVALFSLIVGSQGHAGGIPIYLDSDGHTLRRPPVSTGISLDEELQGRLTSAQLSDIILRNATIPLDERLCSKSWNTWHTHIITVRCSTESVTLKDKMVKAVPDSRMGEPKESLNLFVWSALAYLGLLFWVYRRTQERVFVERVEIFFFVLGYGATSISCLFLAKLISTPNVYVPMIPFSEVVIGVMAFVSIVGIIVAPFFPLAIGGMPRRSWIKVTMGITIISCLAVFLAV